MRKSVGYYVFWYFVYFCSFIFVRNKKKYAFGGPQASFKDNAKYNELDTFKKEVLINFMNTTSLDIYRKWVDEGKKIPLKDIIEMSNSLMQLGMKGFIG